MNSIKKQLVLCLRLVIVSTVFILVLGAFSSISLAQENPPRTGIAETPFQSALNEAINSRRAAGLAVGRVSTENRAEHSGGASIQSQGNDIEMVTITAVTTVEFSHPREAGYARWPDLVVEDNVPSEMTGTVATGNYTQAYYDAMADALPSVWETYDFGYEPRSYSYTETLSLPASVLGISSGSGASIMSLSSEQILMGFTYTGPNLDYAIEESAEVCIPVVGCATLFYFKAGFELDWSLGLRLPADVTLSGPDSMISGQGYNFSSSLNPADWSSGNYSSFGVAAEEGNEFVLRLNFFVGVQGEVVGINLCSSCAVDVSEDFSTSFATPFGSGSSFPIPDVNIPIYEFDLSLFYFSVGLGITPILGSTNIQADWATSGDAFGSGTVTYTQPNQAASFGLVQACNLDPNTNMATVELSNFRYNFNQFQIDIDVFLQFELFGYGVWNPTVDIITFDLSPIFGSLGLAVGDHVQCSFDFSCSRIGPDNRLSISVPVSDETPPITSIGLAGTAGTNGWFISNVTVTLTPDDQPAGCGSGIASTEYSMDGISFQNYTGSFVISTEGIHTVYFRSTDLEGNVETVKTQEVKIDKTPPIITGAPTTLPNAFGWYNTDVIVHFEASDAVSGLFFVTPDVTLSAEGADQSVLGTAIDMAGLSANYLVTGINIDKTPPDLTISEPLPTVYANTDSFTIQWTASDALSGIATETATLDGIPVTNGQFFNLLLMAAGPHVLEVTVLDKADNVTIQTVEFMVTTDIYGTIDALNYMCEIGWITNQGICNSLLQKLNNAARKMEQGQCDVAENMLNAFLNELNAQNGNHVSPEAYAVLSANVNYILANMDCDPVAAVEEPSEEPVAQPTEPSANNGNSNGNSNGNAGGGNSNGNSNGNAGGGGNSGNSGNAGNGNGNAGGGNAGNGNSNGNSNGNGANH